MIFDIMPTIVDLFTEKSPSEGSTLSSDESTPRIYTIDELVEGKKDFVNRIVPVRGRLVGYDVDKGKGVFTCPMKLTVEGERFRITAGGRINRGQDFRRIRPYLKSYFKEEIGLNLFANDYTIVGLTFGNDSFRVRR